MYKTTKLWAIKLFNTYLKKFLLCCMVFALFGLSTQFSYGQVDGCQQIASIDFAAAHPSQVTQLASTDNEVFWGNDGNTGNPDNAGGKWRIESLEPQDYDCFDEVPFFVELKISENAACSNMSVKLPISWLCNTTGQGGIGVSDIRGWRLNKNDPAYSGGGTDETLDFDYGTDWMTSATPTQGNGKCDLESTFTINGLDPGETVILRIDVLLDCDLNSSPTGNIQGSLGEFANIEILSGTGTNCACANLQGGAQTIPWKVALPECPDSVSLDSSSDCEGEDIVFTATTAAPGANTFIFFLDNNNNFTFDAGDTSLQNGNSNAYTDVGQATHSNGDVVTVEVITEGGVCMYYDQTTVSVYDKPSANAVPTNVSCHGASDGSIDLTVTGGTAPFTYDWDNDGTGDFNDPQDLSGLAPGTYNVTVKDSNGCTTTSSATISQSDDIVLTTSYTNVTCHGEDDGTITAS
uniref:hypothetical protein n=1 Tax=uncultured Algibacter sp. TaxID=298659 RepID=UPI002634833F